MSFRLATLFYLMALVASAAIAFGAWGLLAASLTSLAALACSWLRFRGGEELARHGAPLVVPLAVAAFLIARNNWIPEFPFEMLERKNFIPYFCLFMVLGLMPTHPAVWRRIAPHWVKEQEDFARGEE
jgi:hypothetical protein